MLNIDYIVSEATKLGFKPLKMGSWITFQSGKRGHESTLNVRTGQMKIVRGGNIEFRTVRSDQEVIDALKYSLEPVEKHQHQHQHIHAHAHGEKGCMCVKSMEMMKNADDVLHILKTYNMSKDILKMFEIKRKSKG